MEKITRENLQTQTDNLIKSTVLYKKYYNSRAQAKTRGQEWNLTRDEFNEIWLKGDRWQHSGQYKMDLVLARHDMNGPWSKENTHVTTRHEMLQCAAQYRKQHGFVRHSRAYYEERARELAHSDKTHSDV